MKECSELAKIRTYKPFDIVFCVDNDQMKCAHIILSGRCSVLQYLNMNTKLDGKIHNLKPPSKKESTSHDIIQQIFASNDNRGKMLEKTAPCLDQKMDSRSYEKHPNVQTTAEIEQSETTKQQQQQHTREHFIEIGTIGCGAIFALGEHMEDRVIVAKHMEVQCLLIPHYWLFKKKQNVGNIWQRAKIYLDFTLPSRQEVFKHYLEAKKWKFHRNKLVCKSGQLKPQINTTRIEDVPILCRLNGSL
ncbi:uncharacterized protein LOC129575806 [Sitodiplosis mosellana]|uniref:uncharacterized protein LOC129575806 n=1 Tax=Sitodiplosis mosellana TaxID=263140 RepID=UPI002443E8EA|nr:uncharacterized protein LOC129575806 [Sitodiplosis mosellana]